MELQLQSLLSKENGSRQELCSAEVAQTLKASGKTMELGRCGWRLGHATSSLIVSLTIYMLKQIQEKKKNTLSIHKSKYMSMYYFAQCLRI